jgi:tetratricopeptide (TPR) repeat protein
MAQIGSGYSEEEILSLYDLARISVEGGELKRAEIIATGLCEVVPDFSPAFLILAYCQVWSKDYEAASDSSERAYKISPNDLSVLFFVAATKLLVNDSQRAGTILGEIGELLEKTRDTEAERLYRLLLARFQMRTR